MTEVLLRSAAWYGDTPITLNFPEGWEVMVLGGELLPALTTDCLREALSKPIGAPPLSELAVGRNRAAIIVDDLTRPTPAAQLIPLILEELLIAGLTIEAITIIVAGGTHPPSTDDELSKKVGRNLPEGIRVIAHNARCNLVDVGVSSRGTPLYVNRAVMECDLKIGLGCIYPHPAAGFSGGSKIIMPAVCGVETTRTLHDYRRGSGRGGSMETELRQEIEEVAGRVGLDFIVNVVLSQERQIAGMFAGDRVLAHRAGVAYAQTLYSVMPPQDAHIVVADMYPFDSSLQFATDRGLWPMWETNSGTSLVVLAECPQGVGYHELFPVADALYARLRRRLKHLQWRDFQYPLAKLNNMRKLWQQKQLELLVLSNGLRADDLRAVFPKARLYRTWPELRRVLEARHSRPPVRVAVYRCAPFQMSVQQ
jgi:nickel-dependent lactate racemase